MFQIVWQVKWGGISGMTQFIFATIEEAHAKILELDAKEPEQVHSAVWVR